MHWQDTSSWSCLPRRSFPQDTGCRRSRRRRLPHAAATVRAPAREARHRDRLKSVLKVSDAQLAKEVGATREYRALRGEEHAKLIACSNLDDAGPGERSDLRRNRDFVTVAVAELAAG